MTRAGSQRWNPVIQMILSSRRRIVPGAGIYEHCVVRTLNVPLVWRHHVTQGDHPCTVHPASSVPLVCPCNGDGSARCCVRGGIDGECHDEQESEKSSAVWTKLSTTRSVARPKDTHKSWVSIMDRVRETMMERKRRRKGGFLYNFDSHEQRSTFVSSGKPPGVVVVVHLAAPACLQRVAHVVPSFLGCPTSTSLIHRRHELADDDVTAAAWRARQNVDGLTVCVRVFPRGCQVPLYVDRVFWPHPSQARLLHRGVLTSVWGAGGPPCASTWILAAGRRLTPLPWWRRWILP